MSEDHFPRRTPAVTELTSLLRGLADAPPAHEVDWAALRRSIHGRAEGPLARRRTALAPPTAPAWRRRRVLAPLVAAAGIALAVWVGIGTGVTTGPAAGAAFPTAEEALMADISEEEFRELVSGRAHADELLLIALD